MIVICNGMLRSASTLQFNIARLLIKESGRTLLHQEFIERPDHQVFLRLIEIDDLCGFCVVKTHHFPLLVEYAKHGVRVLHSHRDPMDIAASIRKKWSEPFDEILRDIQYMIDVEQQLRDMPSELLLSQPYSLLALDPFIAARAIAWHLSLDLDEDAIKTSIEPLRIHAVTRTLGSRSTQEWCAVDGVDPVNLFHWDHISTDMGADGTWRRIFSETEISMLRAKFGCWRASHGYV